MSSKADETGGGESSPEAVVLLHGMGRTRLSMAILALRLRRAGFETHLFGYSARREPLDELTDRLREVIRRKVRTDRYHIVGHSLGNVILRHGFRDGYREGLKRIVMLAPPNGPAALASSLRESRLYAGGPVTAVKRDPFDPEPKARVAPQPPNPASPRHRP